MKKDMHVSNETQLHMSTTYRRNQSGTKEKTGAKRVFSYVIGGMLIAATMVGSVVLPAGTAEASPAAPSVEYTQVKDQSPQEAASRQEAVQINNLRMANKVLSAALKSGQLDGYVYQNITKRLDTISSKIDQGAFSDPAELSGVLSTTGDLLRTMVDESVGTGVLTQRAESLQALDRLTDKLADSGNQEAAVGQYAASKLGLGYAGAERDFAVQLGANAKQERWGASTALSAVSTASSPSVTINGVKMGFNQSPVIRNNTVMVPMRDIFEAFGAKVSWNAATQTVTATKSGVTMQLKMNSAKATIDGRAVTLTSPAVSIKGTTMVPLRFVSEALNANVTWNAAQNRVEIKADGVQIFPPAAGGNTGGDGGIIGNLPNTGVPNAYTVNGIKVKYSGHSYGSDNQAQYDQVVSMAKSELANKKPMPKFFDEYMNGERFDGNRGNRSDKNVALKNLDGRIGPLVQAGVPRATIEKLLQGTMSAGTFVGQAKDYGDADGQYSAYHTMVKKTTDCDAIAQTYSLMLDHLGFSTGVYRQPGHAEAVVNIPGYGYFFMAGSNFTPTGGPSNMDPNNTVMVGFNK